MDSLFIRACFGKKNPRPPLWFMRQAGRYLPEYRKIRSKFSFLKMCRTPELATQITLQPIQRFGFDSAILFSDILFIPEAMGRSVVFQEGQRPFFENPIQNRSDIDTLEVKDAFEQLDFVYKAIVLCKKELGKTPLIGFSGSPFTVCCYLLETGKSKNFESINQWMYKDPEYLHKLLEKISQVTIDYLNKQIQSGVDAIQIFESWGHLLTQDNFRLFCVHYLKKIVNSLQRPPHVPVIIYSKGNPLFLEDLTQTGSNVLSVSWTIPLKTLKKTLASSVGLQGNFHPHLFHADNTVIKKMIVETIGDMKDKSNYILNLGHGILPWTPVDKVAFFVETVKNYQSS